MRTMSNLENATKELTVLADTLTIKASAAMKVASEIKEPDKMCRFLAERYMELIDDLVEAGLIRSNKPEQKKFRQDGEFLEAFLKSIFED